MTASESPGGRARSPHRAGSTRRSTREIAAAFRWSSVACRLAVLLLAAAPAFAAADLTLDDLLRSLAVAASGQAEFTEERSIAALDTTLQSSGRLAYAAPDHFECITLRPTSDALIVDGNTLTLRRGQHTRTLQLDTVPEAEAVVAALRGSLTGDATVLKRLYTPTVRGTAAAWRLTLVPREAALRHTVASIELQGTGHGLQVVALQLGNGDRSLMRIAPLVAAAAPQRPR